MPRFIHMHKFDATFRKRKIRLGSYIVFDSKWHFEHAVLMFYREGAEEEWDVGSQNLTLLTRCTMQYDNALNTAAEK